jgi:hypothetical protein
MGFGEELRPTVGKFVYAAVGAATGHLVPKWYQERQERRQKEADERYLVMLRRELGALNPSVQTSQLPRTALQSDAELYSKVDQLSGDVKQLASAVSDLLKAYKGG